MADNLCWTTVQLHFSAPTGQTTSNIIPRFDEHNTLAMDKVPGQSHLRLQKLNDISHNKFLIHESTFENRSSTQSQYCVIVLIT